MSKSRKFLTVLTLGLLASGSGIAQAETLQEAVKYTLQASHEVRAQLYNQKAREKEVRQAKAGYLPTMDLTLGAGFGRQHEPAFDTTWPATATVSVRQNVFRFFATQHEVERQQARARSQEHLVHGSSENVALQACRAYLNVLKNQELLELAQENLTNHQRIHDQVKLRSESGVDRRADYDQVKGRLALSLANLAAARANLEDSVTDFQAVIGYRPGELTAPEPLEIELPTSIEEAEELALRNNPVLKSAGSDLDARNAQHDTAKSLLYPSLDVALDYRWQQDYTDPGKNEEFLAMAFVTFNVLNGGWNKARLGQTRNEIYEAQEILENAKRQTLQSIRLSWEANRSAAERVYYLQQYVGATAQTADAFAAQWSIGRRTMFDLLDTQAELINAQASLVNAQYDQTYSEYRILNGISRLLPTLGLQPLGRGGEVTAGTTR